MSLVKLILYFVSVFCVSFFGFSKIPPPPKPVILTTKNMSLGDDQLMTTAYFKDKTGYYKECYFIINKKYCVWFMKKKNIPVGSIIHTRQTLNLLPATKG